jgi:hypothetical protein
VSGGRFLADGERDMIIRATAELCSAVGYERMTEADIAARGVPGASGRPPPLTARAALGGAEAVVRREIALGGIESLSRLVSDFIYAASVPFLGQREALRFARQAEELLEAR